MGIRIYHLFEIAVHSGYLDYQPISRYSPIFCQLCKEFNTQHFLVEPRFVVSLNFKVDVSNWFPSQDSIGETGKFQLP